MRFTFLGTGTSSGVPIIACPCAVCSSTDARDQRLRTGAAIEFTDPSGNPRTILLDTTPDLRQQALRARLQRCDAVLFTHNHVDHIFGLDEVRRFNAVQKAPVDIYGDAHTLTHLRQVYRYIFEARNNVNQSFVATLIAHEIRGEEPFELFGLRVTPIPLLHGHLPVLGYRIEPAASTGKDPAGILPMAYCTDVSAIPPESWRHLTGLNTLVLDALRHRKHPTHFTIDQAIHAAQHTGARRTWFVHMTHDLPHAETDASLPEGIGLAYDGLTLGDLAQDTPRTP